MNVFYSTSYRLKTSKINVWNRRSCIRLLKTNNWWTFGLDIYMVHNRSSTTSVQVLKRLKLLLSRWLVINLDSHSYFTDFPSHKEPGIENQIKFQKPKRLGTRTWRRNFRKSGIPRTDICFRYFSEICDFSHRTVTVFRPKHTQSDGSELKVTTYWYSTILSA